MTGRRVLFVDPPSVIQEQMIQFLVTAQFEAAIIRDPRKLDPLLRAFAGSVVYFNLDSRMKPEELERVVTSVIEGKSRHGAEVGILSYNENPELAKHYLMELGASCGYVVLQLGFRQSAQIIIRALEAVEAKGQRKFVRVKAPSGRASFNVTVTGVQLTGQIVDLSIAGMACVLPKALAKGEPLDDIQLQLWGTYTKVSGTVAGVRESGEGATTVIMFGQIEDGPTRSKIYGFLKRVMQHEVDRLVGS